MAKHSSEVVQLIFVALPSLRMAVEARGNVGEEGQFWRVLGTKTFSMLSILYMQL